MRYISTRSTGSGTASFSEILLSGLAPDGGLYVPEHYPDFGPELDELRIVWATSGYAGLAHRLLSRFIDDIDSDELLHLCQMAYSEQVFSDPAIVPVSRIGHSGVWLAHLSGGPTAAFKDVAMQFLGQVFAYELERRDDWLTVLGATSGDTGSAAEYAMLDHSRIRVAMLTPRGRMTPFQQAQMFSIDNRRIANLSIDGVFDDCQDLVKAVNADADFKARWHIGAVNSINFARVLAQIVYYFAVWIQVTQAAHDQISFAVPTGNFGNILAGYLAKRLGLPIAQLILVTNENNVLEEFFRTGTYRPRPAAQTFATSSPSMDISKASNLERFVYDLVGRDGARTAELFGPQLDAGQFQLDPQLLANSGFVALSSTHADRLATIRKLWSTEQLLIDPHTADGLFGAWQLRDQITTPIAVLETALPIKFERTIKEAIGQGAPVPARFAAQLTSERHVTELPGDASALKRWLMDWLQS